MPFATETTAAPGGTAGASRPKTSRIRCVGIDASTRSQPERAAAASSAKRSPAGSGWPGRYFAFSRVSRIRCSCAASRPQSVTASPLSTSSAAITVAIAPLPITATRSKPAMAAAYGRPAVLEPRTVARAGVRTRRSAAPFTVRRPRRRSERGLLADGRTPDPSGTPTRAGPPPPAGAGPRFPSPPERPLTPPARPRVPASAALFAFSAGTLGLLAGCEADSYFDPSVVGRWEPTPVTMPILSELDVIDDGDDSLLPVTPVRPEDLEPDVQEYTLGSSDVVTITVYELIEPGQDSVFTRRIDETGSIRLPIVGQVSASGTSPSQLEDAVTSTLEQKGILRDAQVSVVVNESGQNLFHVVGTPGLGNTRFGTYAIPQPDYRLLEAVAAAGGVTDRAKHLFIFRQTALTPGVAGTAGPGGGADPRSVTAPATSDPESLLDDLLQGGDGDPAPEAAPEAAPAAPAGIEAGLDGGGGGPQWVYVDGRWVPAGSVTDGEVANALDGETPELSEAQYDELSKMITQRIIEIPYERLLDGDMRFNVVVRPGDVIRVPNEENGFAYLTGQISRGGVYTVPGENRLTLKQSVAAAGGLGPLANPKRVDLVRRIGDDTEATIRLDLKAIYDGTQPDIFLKVEDQINIGTSFWAVPLAIVPQRPSADLRLRLHRRPQLRQRHLRRPAARLRQPLILKSKSPAWTAVAAQPALRALPQGGSGL